MHRRIHITARSLALALSATLAAALCVFAPIAPAAHAIPPAEFPDGTTRTVAFSNATPVAISAGAPAAVTSTIEASGVQGVIWDIDVRTFVRHTWSSDIHMTIQSPDGTIVTLTTKNGLHFDNVFNGTLWDDDADPDGQVPYPVNNGLATDHLYLNNVVATTLGVNGSQVASSRLFLYSTR